MSRQLPPRPNLEYLKKQAKDLLHELQRQNPSAQLADAQHALAREYGFSSWPVLKTHVESVSPFTGEWTADLTRSERHPANQFRSATIVFDVVGDEVHMTDVVIDESGREERHVNIIRVDGRERSADPTRTFSVRATWRDRHTLEAVALRDGQTIGGATYAVSADGKTMTVSAPQQRVVLDRVG